MTWRFSEMPGFFCQSIKNGKFILESNGSKKNKFWGGGYMNVRVQNTEKYGSYQVQVFARIKQKYSSYNTLYSSYVAIPVIENTMYCSNLDDEIGLGQQREIGVRGLLQKVLFAKWMRLATVKLYVVKREGCALSDI